MSHKNQTDLKGPSIDSLMGDSGRHERSGSLNGCSVHVDGSVSEIDPQAAYVYEPIQDNDDFTRATKPPKPNNGLAAGVIKAATTSSSASFGGRQSR